MQSYDQLIWLHASQHYWSIEFYIHKSNIIYEHFVVQIVCLITKLIGPYIHNSKIIHEHCVVQNNS